jgi:hypothetical protein
MYHGTNRTAVILGGSSSIWDDYKYVQSIRAPQDLIHFAVNDISIHFFKAPIQHIVSYHSDMIAPLRKLYKLRFNADVTTHGWKDDEGVDMSWWGKITNNGGTSSLFAVEIALELGITDIIVCGVTLDGRPHYFEDCRQEKGEHYDFGRVPEIGAWKAKLFGKEHMIKGTSGVIAETFGVAHGK